MGVKLRIFLTSELMEANDYSKMKGRALNRWLDSPQSIYIMCAVCLFIASECKSRKRVVTFFFLILRGFIPLVFWQQESQ